LIALAQQLCAKRADCKGGMEMITRLTAFALAGIVVANASHAGEIAPGSAYSIHLDRFAGVVYYAVEPNGYKVVATLAARANGPPIRFTSTLGPGQRMMISVPRSPGQSPVDFEILRNGTALLVADPVSSTTSALAN
jgi:hypothetical protein